MSVVLEELLVSSGWQFTISDDYIAVSLPKGGVVKFVRHHGAAKGHVSMPDRLVGDFKHEHDVVGDMWTWDGIHEVVIWLMDRELSEKEKTAIKEQCELVETLRHVPKTEINSTSTVRQYQDLLRDILLKVRGKCELSEIDDPCLLVTSHIKPWCDCGDNAEERLDFENVLLLSANWDALFDKKYISFDPETGRMIKARRIDEETLRKFGVPDNWQTSVKITIGTDRRKEYLRWHKRLMAEEDMLNNAKRSQPPSS